MSGKSEMEIRPFYEAADLAAFMTPEDLSAPRRHLQQTRARGRKTAVKSALSGVGRDPQVASVYPQGIG
jgi:hypothetical protein